MSGAIIFDLDGVLIDSEGLQYQAYSRVLSRFGVTVSPEEYGEHWIAAGLGPEHAVETYRLPIDAAELRALKNPVYYEILRQDVTLMPGARAALTRLHEHFPLALATNSNIQDVDFVMDHFAIRGFFTGIVTREHYVLPKPNPDAFLAAAAALHTPAHACIVVEDAYKGIVAAHRAGAVPVAVPNAFTRGNDFSLAVTILRNLDELTVDLAAHLLAVHTPH